MRPTLHAGRPAIVMAVALALAGCASGPEVQTARSIEADFSDPLANEEERLIRPPNVIAAEESVLLQVGAEGGSRLLPEISQARIHRDGAVRWLEVDVPIEQAWPTLRQFWQEQGFALEADLPEAGLIVTSWQQDRSQVLGTGLSKYLDIAFGTINDTGIRHQFRARVERGDQVDSSNIFITHRAVEEIGTGARSFQPLPADRILEVEMMRRLMIMFRLPEESVATLDEFVADEGTNDLYELAGNELRILRPFDDGWRLLGLALDRAGYTVKDKDKDTGIITLLTANPSGPDKQQNLFERLFGDTPEDGALRDVELNANAVDANTVLVIAPANAEGETILRLVAENL